MFRCRGPRLSTPTFYQNFGLLVGTYGATENTKAEEQENVRMEKTLTAVPTQAQNRTN